MAEPAETEMRPIETDVPARLDRLPWSQFHWMIVIGLGAVWILDGLEVTIIGSIASRLTEKGSGLTLDPSQIGSAAAFYVAGACLGALFFGQLTDRFGRKKLFLVTLGVYIFATVATAFSFSVWYFYAARFFTGAGIGGEYAAINSAIDELIPARVRGRVDLIINGSYWLGAAGGALLAVPLLDTALFAADFGWRLAFGIGAALGIGILLVRRHVPESPRWLFIHGRGGEADEIVGEIEQEVREETGQQLEDPGETIRIRPRKRIRFGEIARTAFSTYPRRTVLGLALFVGQAFLYNAVTFDLGTLLSEFFEVGSGTVPLYIALFAFSNFLGPLTLGRFFDTIGRKPMVSATYLLSALVTAVLGVMLLGGSLTTWSFMAFILVIFFIASAGASSAYLTVSEIFPMETRAGGEEEERERRPRPPARPRPAAVRVWSSPGMPVSAPLPGVAMEHEVDVIDRALQEHGSANRRELGRRVGARYWGPGRFHAALREAVANGRVKRLRGGEYAPVTEA